MNNLTFDRIIDQYFDCFEQKDIEGLKEIIAPNVCLQDWNNREIGIENFVNVVQDNFAEFNQIKIIRVRTDITFSRAYCLIKLEINQNTPEDILDIISINDLGQIILIDAYRQF